MPTVPACAVASATDEPRTITAHVREERAPAEPIRVLAKITCLPSEPIVVRTTIRAAETQEHRHSMALIKPPGAIKLAGRKSAAQCPIAAAMKQEFQRRP